MKPFLKSALHNPKSAIAALAFLVLPCAAKAQSLTMPMTVASNAVTWVPQPQTNVILIKAFVPAHTITIQNANFGVTNALSIPFYISLDGTNKIFYYMNGYGTDYNPSTTNTTDTVVFPATNLNLYVHAAILTTNDASSSLQVGINIVQ
jgi:hypothetical protein